jgi:hypothetical protein
MIRIAITQAAFDAIAATLPLGSVGYENKTDVQGQQFDLAGPGIGRPSALAARPRRELQRRDHQAGVGKCRLRALADGL